MNGVRASAANEWKINLSILPYARLKHAKVGDNTRRTSTDINFGEVDVVNGVGGKGETGRRENRNRAEK